MAQGDDILLNIAFKMKSDEAAAQAEGARVGSIFFRSFNAAGTAMSIPESLKLANEAIEAKRRKEAGGILGDLKSSALGGGVAGAAAAGVLLLVEGLKAVAKESKVLSMFTDNVSKALGLLIDLILMPFLPLLVGALVGLYQAVMWLGKVWNDFFKGKTIDDPLGTRKTPPVEGDPNKPTYDLFKSFGKFWEDVFAGTVKWLSDIWAQLTGWWEGVKKQWEILQKTWDEFWSKITWENLEKWWADVTKNFTSWVEGVGKQWDILVETLSTFWDDLKSGIIGFINSIMTLWNSNPVLKAIKTFDLIEDAHNQSHISRAAISSAGMSGGADWSGRNSNATTPPSSTTVVVQGDVYNLEKLAKAGQDIQRSLQSMHF